MAEYPFQYECSICKKLLDPNEVAKHVEKHREEENYPGYLRLIRRDRTDQ